MAQAASFDITSTVDLQEVDNAVNQARKELAQRYDFKGSRAAIELDQKENTIVLTADDAQQPEKDMFFRYYERAKARGWKTIVLEGDHIVHVTKTAETARPLAEAP